ncbi:HpcH/HpaI aldolase/citrate lyase family protein [Peribacillus frigoritolerans]|uniref:HpcH/HpaI aldolase/citrate lyase family protein n=1 Tax=Peribacillus frigoritolerans TaxID=450367 RepID=UPI0007BF345A|nr:CoA ester lyase [Peribacillus frigoritolerans]MBD8133926.1 CoA ester lyase [Bacillus sp. CFBP 13597]MCR8869814.1 CoA ester lyase [Peribacillus frigoritolerans]TWE00587.1 citrate lyase subunit beta/citryl-CoA lyase [Peribacillus frigoritolerans]
MTLQSYLFVPGDKERIIKKALTSDADIVIIDLEDAIAEDEKENARQVLSTIVEEVNLQQRPVGVRINGIDTGHWQADLKVVFKSNIKWIMLPKCESAEDIEQLIHLVEQNYISNFSIIPLIESAKGVLNAYKIATSHDSIQRLAFGSVDYLLDIGAVPSKQETELLFARSMLINSSVAAGIESPIDCPYIDFNNEEGFIETVTNAKYLGMQAKLLIHPKQIELLHKLYKPSDEEINQSKAIVQLFEEALSNGKAAIAYQGKMIDYPVYKQAKRNISRNHIIGIK